MSGGTAMFKRSRATRRALRTNYEDKWAGEGIRKLHSEILQHDNQRFLVTTTAVVLFGSFAGWVTTVLLRSGGSVNPQQEADVINPLLYLPPAITILVWTVLYLLFRYQISLALTIRWLAVYHMLKGSDWEWTWHVFRQQHKQRSVHQLPYIGSYRVTTNIFSLLAVASYAYFLVLQIVLSPPAIPDTWEALWHTLVALVPNWKGPLPEALTPGFCWILLTVLLPLLTILFWINNRRVLEVNEAEMLEDWKKAEADANLGNPSPATK
jgi:hypothetical protein